MAAFGSKFADTPLSQRDSCDFGSMA